jgi:hypothetical protein
MCWRAWFGDSSAGCSGAYASEAWIRSLITPFQVRFMIKRVPRPAGHLAAFSERTDAGAKRGRSRRADHHRGRHHDGARREENPCRTRAAAPHSEDKPDALTKPINHIPAVLHPVGLDEMVRPAVVSANAIVSRGTRHRRRGPLLCRHCDSPAQAGTRTKDVVPSPGRTRLDLGGCARRSATPASLSARLLSPLALARKRIPANDPQRPAARA